MMSCLFCRCTLLPYFFHALRKYVRASGVAHFQIPNVIVDRCVCRHKYSVITVLRVLVSFSNHLISLYSQSPLDEDSSIQDSAYFLCSLDR